MRILKLIGLLTLINLTIVLHAQTTITCPADGTASVYSGLPNTNFSRLTVGDNSGEEFKCMVHFDISAIPPNADILEAEMRLNYSQQSDWIGIGLHRITSNWNVNSVTWNNFPNYVTNPYGIFWTTNGAIGYHIYIPVEEIVAEWIENGESNWGILLKKSGGTGMAEFFALNASPDDKPLLDVTYTILLPPSTPSSLTATVISSTQINVSWENVSNEDGYKVYSATSSGGTYTQIGTTGTNVTSFSNTGLIPNTLYCFKVKAYNSSGDSGFSPYDSEITSTSASPDLSVTNTWAFPTEPTIGDQCTLNANIKNIGNTTSSSTSLKWYLNGNEIIDVAVSSITSGQEITVPTSYTFSISGQHILQGCVESVSGEINFENNCREVIPFEINPGLIVSPNSVELRGYVGDYVTFQIKTNVNWEISVESHDWFNLSSTNGSGNQVMTIIASSTNVTGSARTATLTITASGFAPQFVTVTQGSVLGINECAFSEFVTVFPNPATDKINIKNSSSDLILGEIELTNLIGSSVYKSEFPSTGELLEIPVEGFLQGVYFIKLQTNKGIVIKKIIIQR